MTGYIVLGALVFLLIGLLAAYLLGIKKGRETERRFYEEENAQRAKDAALYRVEKDKIMREAFGNAEQKKAELSRGGTGRNRFNNINNSLRE